MSKELAETLAQVFTSPNVPDSNMEPANLVDVIDDLGVRIVRAAKLLGDGNASTAMAHGKTILDGCNAVASAINGLADAVRELVKK